VKTWRILIVDDSRGVRNALTLMLSPRGFDCVQAENGVRALEVLSAEHIDAVLTDLHMPELDGLELLGFMRRDAALRDTPVFVLTGDWHEEAVDELERAGATGVLRKPVSRDQLVATLQGCLG
jgi:CheY-like chemotaxis protein